MANPSQYIYQPNVRQGTIPGAIRGVTSIADMFKQREQKKQLNQIAQQSVDPNTGQLDPQKYLQGVSQYDPQLGYQMQQQMQQQQIKQMKEAQQFKKLVADTDYSELRSKDSKFDEGLRLLRTSTNQGSYDKFLGYMEDLYPGFSQGKEMYSPGGVEQLRKDLIPMDKQMKMALEEKRIKIAEENSRLREKSLDQLAVKGEYYKAKTKSEPEKLELSKKKFERKEKEEDIARATKAAKNTKGMYGIIRVFQEVDDQLPGGLYGRDNISGFGFGTKPLRKFWKTKEANAIRGAVQRLINVLLKERSGAAVTDQEFERLEAEFGISTTGTMDEFRRGLLREYEGQASQYDRFRRADPEAFNIIEKKGSDAYGRWLKGGEMQETEETPSTSGVPTDDDIMNMSEEDLDKLLKEIK